MKANYLASPPLVVAYALAGTTDIDLATEPLGKGKDGKDVLSERHLADRRGSRQDGRSGRASRRCSAAAMRSVWDSNPKWNRIADQRRRPVRLEADSTYIQEPPFLLDLAAEPGPIEPIRGARVLAALGDSVTTDHISPAGSIAAKSPAGQYLARARRRSRSTSTATAPAAATTA